MKTILEELDQYTLTIKTITEEKTQCTDHSNYNYVCTMDWTPSPKENANACMVPKQRIRSRTILK